MRSFLSILLLCLLASVVACSGCESDTTNNEPEPEPEPCVDADGDGWETGTMCEGLIDCDDTDGTVYPGATELCDGLDNDCDNTTDEECEGCEIGETRPCGSDEGACIKGIQTCREGVWSNCDGETPPATELCNGEDDDCDGEVDEGGDSLCDDELLCNGAEVCSEGACVPGEEFDCSELDGPCVVGMCSEKDGGCREAPLANGTVCDDGNRCTLEGICSGGECEAAPIDCSEADDQCNAGVCNPLTGQCVPEPIADGTMCDDDQFCTVSDICNAGACVGQPNDCLSAADQCNAGVCDEMNDECVPTPIGDGTACDDSLYCTVNEVCQAGQCAGGMPRSCGAAGGSCRDGVCDEANDTCTGDPVPDGTVCEDGDFCTTSDTCAAGTCVGGGMRDCSAQDGLCKVGVCNEDINQCVPGDSPNDIPCDDGRWCTEATRCNAGACIGVPRDCDSLVGGDCLLTSCDEQAQMCRVNFDPACCNINLDADLDGTNECLDCDDTNGAAYPGAPEFCNGFDDDCDGQIDEDFDIDRDGASVCSRDPQLFDCDDNDDQVFPGAPERCDDGMGGDTGNGKDDNCNGYIDETCGPCSTVDEDGDGVAECDGDCNPMDATSYPGAPEICDGLDNDCNTFTNINCDVSDPCNQDLDGNFGNDPDVCQDEQICACLVDAAGQCTGNWFCTAYCNNSSTGAVGDGCTATQSCRYDILRTAGIHGCGEVTQGPGTKQAGESCSTDAECRSVRCIDFDGAGDFRCFDFCPNDSYCPQGTRCSVLYSVPDPPTSTITGDDSICVPSGYLGTNTVGTGCINDLGCDHWACIDDPDGTQRYCTQPCCADSDCPSGFGCSLRGDGLDSGSVFVPDNAPSCNRFNNGQDCPDGAGDVCFEEQCAWRLQDIAPVCVRDQAGQGTRVAGQACSSNLDCASSFCEKDLNVCVDVCCTDADCPTGLTCTATTIETDPDRATEARLCLNLSTDRILQRL